MKFSLDMLYEKGWGKAIIAGVGLLVGIGLVKAVLLLFFDHPAVTAQQNVAVAVPAESRAALVQEQVLEAAPLVAKAAMPARSSPRRLDDTIKQQLLHDLADKNTNVLVVCARGDNEAKKFGQEILRFLQSQGYAATALSFTSFPPSFTGIATEKDGDRAFVKVGHRS